MTDRATRIGFGFLVSVAAARVLGPETFGVYSFALAITALFAFLGQAGIDALLVRELIKHPERATKTLGESLLLRFAGTALAAVASIATAIIVSKPDFHHAPLLVALLSLSGMFQAAWVIEGYLQARRSFRYTAKAKISAYCIALVLRLGALSLPQPLIGLACATAAESALAALLMWRVARKHFSLRISTLTIPRWDGLISLGKLAAPMLLSSLMVAIYSRIDVFMLGVMADKEVTGLYTTATLISEGFYVLPMALLAAASPRLTSLYLESEEKFKVELFRTIRALSCAGLAIAAITTAAAPIAIRIVFGDQYADATPMLQLHIWSTWIVFVSTASDPWYINHDLRHLYLLKSATAAVLNVCFNLLLIPLWGGIGAAVATVIAYAVAGLVLGIAFKSTRPLFFMQIRAMSGLLRYTPSSMESTP